MDADGVKDVIYQSCLAMDDEKFDEYLALCADDYHYKVTAYSPELRKEMIWLEQSRDDLKAMFDMLPEHVKPDGRFTRHVQVYRVAPNGASGTVNVTSALTIYFTNDRGDTKMFAIGRYYDVVDTTGGTPRLKSREVRLETRSLGTGSQDSILSSPVQVTIGTKTGPLDVATLPGESILAAGLRQGIALPYECATGTCGTCRARLLDGQIDEGWPQAPGWQGLKQARREFLMCQAAPLSECRIALPDPLAEWRAGAERPQEFAARVAERVPLTHDMLALCLALDRPMAFEAGQFVLLEAPETAGFRAYSMANWQSPCRRLDFIIKRKPEGGFSDWLFKRAREGDYLRLFGPLGSAVLEPSRGLDLLVAVGGSGLAVALSILARAAAEGVLGRNRVRLYFGVRAIQDAARLERISEWRERFGEAFAATVALSDAPVGAADRDRWPALCFAEGMVHDVVGRDLEGGCDNTMAFLAGPPPMVDATMRVAMLKGRLPPSRIRFDRFS